MRLIILSLLYLSGVFPGVLSAPLPVPHLYYLIMTPMTWNSAQSYCRKNYEDLATITSDSDWTRLKKLGTNSKFFSTAWIGLYNDIDSWRWSYNSAPLKLKKWSGAEPNNLGGHESCGAMDMYGYWWDLNCELLKPFLCYDANSTKRFFSITVLKSWSDAQAYCREFHTDLATSYNESDNLILKNLVSGQWSAWFGLFRDPWKWSDQSNASSINWAVGSPDNSGGYENCGSVTYSIITDVPCSGFLPFFCHTVPPMTVQDVVKLKVISGLSADSGLESSILALIWEELKKHGMADNTTVTLRLQPDGNVFQKVEESVNSEDTAANKICKT
uniref:Macrophage mannose receptor 1-like n=1 Tax=Astyanax mexicanus TaxID=7994 RepID=A0A3B1JKY3_ASTMX